MAIGNLNSIGKLNNGNVGNKLYLNYVYLRPVTSGTPTSDTSQAHIYFYASKKINNFDELYDYVKSLSTSSVSSVHGFGRYNLMTSDYIEYRSGNNNLIYHYFKDGSSSNDINGKTFQFNESTYGVNIGNWEV